MTHDERNTMTADEALDQLYNVALDEDLLTLDYLMVRAGFRTPTNLDGVSGGEMRPVSENSLETLEELRDNYQAH